MQAHEPIRVLQIIGKICGGGVESVITNYYKFIDRSKIQFDFVVEGDIPDTFNELVSGLGGKVYQVNSYGKNPILYCFKVGKIIKDNKYEIVHCNMNTMSFLALFVAYILNVKVRILHNHSTADRSEGVRYYLKLLFRPLNPLFANVYLACSDFAAYWMYGKKWKQYSEVVPNAIDVRKFSFNSADRYALRKEFALENNFVIGHVGRLEHQKNHDFLLKMFAKLKEINNNVKLVLVGKGSLESSLKESCKRLKISDEVIFLGLRNDTYRLYSMMDVFCLPSHYEGLGVVGVEAQANGLRFLGASNIPREICITQNAQLLPIDDYEPWIEIINSLSLSLERERDYRAEKQVRLSGFDINEEAQNLVNIYFKAFGEK